MKIDFFNAFIAIAISALLAWGLYAMTDIEALKILVGIGSFIALAGSSICSIAIKMGEQRSSIVIRATSGVFFFLLLLLNGIFTFFDFSEPLYIILNSLLLLIMLIINRSVTKSRM